MSHVKLNLSCPAVLGEQVVEYLLESEWMEGGFTSFAGQGHDRDFANSTLAEKVRGRIHILTIMAILPSAHVAPLLAALRERFRSPYLLYWTEPVLDFGDFA